MWPDRLMGRLLFVDVQPQPAGSAETAKNAFGLSLAFSAIRCILQYVLLPFVLPVLGIAAGAATPIYLLISVLAVVAIISSLRRFWKIGYRYRWQYLAIALVTLGMLAVFIQTDLATVLGS